MSKATGRQYIGCVYSSQTWTFLLDLSMIDLARMVANKELVYLIRLNGRDMYRLDRIAGSVIRLK